MQRSLLCIAALLILSGCAQKATHAVSEENVFPVTAVLQMDTSTFTEYPAELNAVQNVELRARVRGYIENIYVDEGARVKKGQVLFTISRSEYTEEVMRTRAQRESAAAELEAAQLQMASVKSLFEKQVVSEIEYAMSQNKVKAAKAKLDEASAELAHAGYNLSYTDIKAPFDGFINRIPHRTGSYIEDGTLLTSISQIDEVFAYFDLSEKEYLNYASRPHKDSTRWNAVSLILANGKPHAVEGKIETIEGQINPGTGNIAFRARFKNPGHLVRHGASGKIRVKRDIDRALLVPQKATYEIQDHIYVYTVAQDGTINSRRIKVSERLPHLFVISEGLKPGDRVVYEGIQNIKEGMKIRQTFITMPQILKQIQSLES